MRFSVRSLGVLLFFIAVKLPGCGDATNAQPPTKPTDNAAGKVIALDEGKHTFTVADLVSGTNVTFWVPGPADMPVLPGKLAADQAALVQDLKTGPPVQPNVTKRTTKVMEREARKLEKALGTTIARDVKVLSQWQSHRIGIARRAMRDSAKFSVVVSYGKDGSGQLVPFDLVIGEPATGTIVTSDPASNSLTLKSGAGATAPMGVPSTAVVRNKGKAATQADLTANQPVVVVWKPRLGYGAGMAPKSADSIALYMEGK